MLCYGREICKSPPLIHCFAPLLHNDAMFYSTATFTDSAATRWANQPDQSLFCVWKIGTSQFPRNEPMMVRSNISNFSRTAPISSCPICSTWKRGHKDPWAPFYWSAAWDNVLTSQLRSQVENSFVCYAQTLLSIFSRSSAAAAGQLPESPPKYNKIKLL